MYIGCASEVYPVTTERVLSTGEITIHFGNTDWLLYKWSDTPEDLPLFLVCKHIYGLGRRAKRGSSIDNQLVFGGANLDQLFDVPENICRILLPKKCDGDAVLRSR